MRIGIRIDSADLLDALIAEEAEIERQARERRDPSN